MPKKNDLSASSGERLVVYERARWKHLSRWFGLVVMVMLNFSMMGSTIERVVQHHPLSFAREVFSWVVVLFFDATILAPLLMEVDALFVAPDVLTIKGLCWKEKIRWDRIVSFQAPIWLRYAILRTPKCVYLLNKRDLQPIDQILETIRFKAPNAIKQR